MSRNNSPNIDSAVVENFGREWSRFDQTALPAQERTKVFGEYFQMFPWQELSVQAMGFDAGCGTGRWASLVAPRVGHLYCIDPSDAIDVAARNLQNVPNCTFYRSSIDDMPIADGSMDFGYSLGVLHHLPDPARGLASCVQKLKPGAPILVYLYYALDNQPGWFRWLWRISDSVRWVVSRLPHRLKLGVTEAIAASVYWPLARMARVLERFGRSVNSFPLSEYRNRSFYTMRTDALDRFGTTLERRFTRVEIAAMMEGAGLERVRFGSSPPYWSALGFRKQSDVLR